MSETSNCLERSRCERRRGFRDDVISMRGARGLVGREHMSIRDTKACIAALHITFLPVMFVYEEKKCPIPPIATSRYIPGILLPQKT